MTRPQRAETSERDATSSRRHHASSDRRARVWIGALVAVMGFAAGLPAITSSCTPSGDNNGFNGSDTTSGNSGDPSGGGGAGGDGDLLDGGFTSPLTISPANPILKLELPLKMQEIQFQCIETSSGKPVDAKFTTTSLELGSISDAGLFKPNGVRTGTTNVKCDYNGTTAETPLKVLIHAVDDTGGMNQQDKDKLRGPPGMSDPQWQFMYPYDNTVFPRGILAPEIHLGQGSFAGTGFYVEISAPDYHYEGFFNASGFNTQLQMSQDAWAALTNSAGGQTVEVRISKLYNGQKYGPIFRRWIIASGKLHGIVYYNTYDSPLAGDGAMMRIKGNSPTPEVLVGQCTVCHSVSSDGSTAAAANHNGPGGLFDLTGGNLNPPLVWTSPEKAAFAGIYPKNGEVFVTNGAPGQFWPPNTPGTNGTWTSELLSKNGVVIPNSGIEGFYAQSPVFSHDGTMLAFTDRQATPPYTSTLALMNYDAAAQKFSNYTSLATPPAGRHYSWPAFTPDGKFVVFQNGTGDDLATWSGNTGRVLAVDIATKQVIYLGGLNGDGYMPAGARDENKNYEPTIAPVASGGYIWVMFTSRRTYGNKLTGSEGETKRLWVSAFSINAPQGTDPTHPAFYVSGQELTSGNSRGFWALEPCKADGADCESGDECCNKFCNPDPNDPNTFVCGPDDGSCASEFEGCKTAADCCDVQLECVNSVCTKIAN